MFMRNVGTFNHYTLQKPKVDSDVFDSRHAIVKTATLVLLVFIYSWPFLYFY